LFASGDKGPFVLEFTEGIVPARGDFDYRNVLENAVKERKWIEEAWGVR